MSSRYGNGRLMGAALILGVASLASRLVGLLRERVLTTTLGAGPTFDSFVAAFRIPDLLFNLVVLGALSASFIPLFTDKLVRGDRAEALDFALAVMNMMLLIVGGLSICLMLLAPVLVPLITPGFSGEDLRLTIQLSRIMALQPLLLAVSFVLSGVLNSFKRFVVYALAPIFYNVGIIFGVVVLVPRFGAVALAWGVVIGAAFHMLIQLPSALAVGFRWRLSLPWRAGDFAALWRMMLPRVVGLAAMQGNLLTVTIVCSRLLAGSITVFHLANNVQHLPVGVFGIAFAQAAFPTLAEQIARGQRRAFVNSLARAFRYIMFFVVPISLFFFLLRAQIIRVLFGDGAFDWEDTILTFETFGYLIASIFAQAAIPLLTRGFYVQQNTKTPVIIAVISMVTNVILALILAPHMGVQGLALAFSVSAIVNMVLLLGVLHWQLGGFNDGEVVSSLWRIALAAVVAGGALQMLKYPVAAVVDMQRAWGVLVQLLAASAGGAGIYLAMTWLLGSDELGAIKKYLPRKPSAATLAAGTETPR